MVAVGDAGAWSATVWAEPLYWLGLVLPVLTVSLRLAQSAPRRTERIGLLLALGLGLYAVKLFQSPAALTYHDEFGQWRVTSDILAHHRLFDSNPLVPIYGRYPGLELVTSAVMSLGHLSMFVSGSVVIALGRILLILALYLLLEAITKSPRIASLAVLLYAANPNFIYFDAQYAYESLALPLVALLLLIVVRYLQARDDSRRWLFGALLPVTAALVMTHHLSTFVVAGFLLLWAIVEWCTQRSTGGIVFRRLALVSGLTMTVALAWLFAVAWPTVGYLTSVAARAVTSLIQLALRQSAGRTLFRSGSGVTDPLLEQIVGMGSVILILVLLPFALWHIVRHHRGPVVLALALSAALYPVSLVLRFTEAGTETSNRASEFLFLGIGLVVTTLVVERWLEPPSCLSRGAPTRGRPFRVALVGMCLTFVLCGGVIVGWSPSTRQPGSYLVGADSRSVNAESIAMAEWSRVFLGSNNRLAADRTNGEVLVAYGDQDPQWTSGPTGPIAFIFTSPTFGLREQAIIHETGIKYLIVDRRLATALPAIGYYFTKTEPGAFDYKQPIALAALQKFTPVPGMNRVFDSGDVAIYDVSKWSTP